MAMEYNPMEEMGFFEDKQLICSCDGFISKNDYLRRLCSKYIRNGERFLDTVDRYDYLVSNVLGRNESRGSNAIRIAIPFLKANGVTDHEAYEFAKTDLALMPGADKAMRYFHQLLPTFIATGDLYHHLMSVTDAIDFPMSNVSCSNVAFDSIEMDRQEAKTLREISTRIATFRPSDYEYLNGSATMLNDLDSKIVSELDSFTIDQLPKMKIENDLKNIVPIGANEKAYALLEIRRKTDIDFSSTVFIGSGATDASAFELIRDSDGLALSFNGCGAAIRGCNIAIMSTNAIPAAVLASEFYNEGIEAVYRMVENWTRDGLRKNPCADRHLVDAMLAAFPRKLPAIYRVDHHNVEEVAAISETYRTKTFK
jgi:energy-converting hydrogenase A subunit R